MRIVKPKKPQWGWGETFFTLFGMILALFLLWVTIGAFDYVKYIADINQERLLQYTGTPTEARIAAVTPRPRGSSYSGAKIHLENGDWINVDYDVLWHNGIQRIEVLNENSWDFYYTQYSTNHSYLNDDTAYHYLVSVAPSGYDEEMAGDSKRALGTYIMLVVISAPLMLWGVLFFSTPLLLELRKCIETKKEQERREKKERRAAERRAKYLEERERLRAEKQKKKH